MNKTQDRRMPVDSNRFHPWIYQLMVALAVVLVVSVWGFAGPGYNGLVLTVVSLFFLVAVGIPVILWRIWSAHAHREEKPGGPESFATWQEREIEIYGARLKGKDVAFQALLPIAAVSIGMAMFALVLYFDVGV